MAPFSEAVRSHRVRVDPDGTAVFAGTADAEWTIGPIPHGGYVLALVVDACIQHQAQAGGAHPDPLHASAHFLKASRTGAFEARVRTLRAGKGYANVLTDFVQDGSTRVTVHFIFGRLLPPSVEAAQRELHLPPGTPFSRRHPLPNPPSRVPLSRPRAVQRFAPRCAEAVDTALHARNTPGAVDKDVGIQHGGWFELVGANEALTLPAVAFFADMSAATPKLLPEGGANPPKASAWYPTLALTVQFLAPVPAASAGFARATVGLYSVGAHVSRPGGRHEERAEVWTAPAAIGARCAGEDGGAWRGRQVCLCVATQMGLTMGGALERGGVAKM